uniref:Organic solute transporter subunit alpha-like n=1 Tax=Saccoglossus kowalevskii TaxID=10224 RepID=A0ABM0LXM3_SACKO|nr:PREDICTED: organic solute transporter subunit alpha-like [Saccoglossus kowalevskii]
MATDYPEYMDSHTVTQIVRVTVAEESNDAKWNCSDEEPYTYDYYAAINRPEILILMLGIMSLLCVLTIGIFADNLRYIHKHLPIPSRRTRVTWIIGTFPVISFTSLIALYIPRAWFICLIHASLYLSLSLYQFMLLIIDYYGGRHAAVKIHEGKTFSLAIPPYACCCCCLPRISLNHRNLRWIKRGVMQVALLRPIELFVSAVLWTDGRYSPGNISSRGGIYTTLNLITIVSTVIAIIALNLMYRISKDVLKDFNITPKFLIMQLTLLLTNVQHMILSIIVSLDVMTCELPMSTYTKSNMLYNFLIVVEMFIIVFVARMLYRRKAGNLHQLLIVEKQLLDKKGEPITSNIKVVWNEKKEEVSVTLERENGEAIGTEMTTFRPMLHSSNIAEDDEELSIGEQISSSSSNETLPEVVVVSQQPMSVKLDSDDLTAEERV